MLQHFFRANANDLFKSTQTASRVRDIYERDFSNMSDREAKHSFIDVCKSLDTYGYLFFPVKQQSLEQMKIFPRKLGISDDHIVLIEQDSNVSHLTSSSFFFGDPPDLVLDFVGNSG